MTRSLDPSVLSRKTSTAASDCSSQLSENFDEFTGTVFLEIVVVVVVTVFFSKPLLRFILERRMTRSAHWPDSARCDSSAACPPKTPFTNDEPLPTSTALVPAPDALISPSIASSLSFYSNSLSQKPDRIVEDDVEPCPAKLKPIKTKAHEKQEQASQECKSSALKFTLCG